MDSQTQISIIKDQGGYVLVISLLVLVLLTLTAVYAAYQSSTEMRVAGNNKSSVQAFYLAQAGLEDARIRLLTTGQSAPFTFGWSTSYNSSSSLKYTYQIRHKTEQDYGKDLNSNGNHNDIVYWGDANGDGIAEQNTTTSRPIEIVTSTGTLGTAKSVIVAELTRDFIPLKYAAFGDKKVDVKNSGDVMKGDPSSGPKTSSPYLANVGSNEEVELKNKSNIYGDVDVGKKTSGTQGQFTDHGANIYGTAPNYIDRIEPDPLGLFTSGSQLANDFAAASSSNDNGKAVTTHTEKVKGVDTIVTQNGLNGNEISLDKGQTMTLTAGNYYVSSIDLKEGCTLNIDVSSGPVNIYLTGAMEAKNGSNINLLPSGSDADKFVIYSNSSNKIEIKNSAEFAGVVYAPHADITIFNSGDFFGMAWGKNVEIKNSGDLIYDPRLKNKFVDSRYSLLSWRERRD